MVKSGQHKRHASILLAWFLRFFPKPLSVLLCQRKLPLSFRVDLPYHLLALSKAIMSNLIFSSGDEGSLFDRQIAAPPAEAA